MAELKGVVEVQVKHHETNEQVKASYDFGSDLDAAIADVGPEAVMYNYVVGAKTALRNRLYALTHGKEGTDIMSAEDALESVKGWKPSVGSERASKDPTTTALGAFDKMNSEQRAAFIAELKTRQSEAE